MASFRTPENENWNVLYYEFVNKKSQIQILIPTWYPFWPNYFRHIWKLILSTYLFFKFFSSQKAIALLREFFLKSKVETLFFIFKKRWKHYFIVEGILAFQRWRYFDLSWICFQKKKRGDKNIGRRSLIFVFKRSKWETKTL